MWNRVVRAALVASMLSCVALAADISGAWQFTLQTPNGKGRPSFEFKQDGEKLAGTYSGKFGKATVSGTVKGDQLEFMFDGPSGKFHYTGTVDGPTSMKGDYELEGKEKGTFTAEKK